MDFYILIEILLIITLYALSFLAYNRTKKKKHSKDPNCPFSDEDNPFKAWEMKEQLKCKKCGKVWEIVFKRFDYVFQKITDDRAKHENNILMPSGAEKIKCDGEVEVSAIWCEYHKEETPQEKKWKEYVKRFK